MHQRFLNTLQVLLCSTVFCWASDKRIICTVHVVNVTANSSERSATRHNHLNSTAHCSTRCSKPGSQTQLLNHPACTGDTDRCDFGGCWFHWFICHRLACWTFLVLYYRSVHSEVSSEISASPTPITERKHHSRYKVFSWVSLNVQLSIMFVSPITLHLSYWPLKFVAGC